MHMRWCFFLVMRARARVCVYAFVSFQHTFCRSHICTMNDYYYLTTICGIFFQWNLKLFCSKKRRKNRRKKCVISHLHTVGTSDRLKTMLHHLFVSTYFIASFRPVYWYFLIISLFPCVGIFMDFGCCLFIFVFFVFSFHFNIRCRSFLLAFDTLEMN